MRLILVRHGESVANADAIYQGWLDSPLSAVGEAQAQATAQALVARGDIRPIAVYASPLQRAWRTGEAIAAAIGLTPESVEGLREINVGDAMGVTYLAARERWPHLEEERRQLGLAQRWPAGESGQEFGARVATTLDTLIGRHWTGTAATAPDEAIILATHGGTIRFALAHLRGDTVNAWPTDPVRNCSLAEVILERAGHQVVVLDDCAHLGL